MEKMKLAIHKGADAELELGGLRFRACRREIDDIDGGVTLLVLGPIGADDSEELLRFDCFRKRPHYHAPAENRAETKIDPVDHGDGREWVFAQLATNSQGLLEEAGRASLSPEVDADALVDLAPRLRALVETLAEPTETTYFDIDPAILRGLATDSRAEADGSQT